MKKAMCGLLVLAIFLSPVLAAAERTEHEKTMLGILADMSLKETFVEEAYLDEEKDVFVITYRQKDLSKKEAEESITYNDDFLKKLSGICQNTLCEYYCDWVDLFKIDIDIVIRHISNDGHFLYCMLNGIFEEKDIINETSAERGLKIEAFLLVLKNSFYSLKNEKKIEMECEYKEEEDEIHIVIIFEGTKEYIKTRDGKKFVSEMKEGAEEIYNSFRESANKWGIAGGTIKTSFTMGDGETILQTINGEIIE